MKKMFTKKDIETRSIYVINCLQKRNLCVKTGNLLLKDEDGSTLTQMPFQKILAIFIIGHITITTPLIDKCRKYGVALIVTKPNLRPCFYWANDAEANFLLHRKQYEFYRGDLSIARHIIYNKILNQKTLLRKTRQKDVFTTDTMGTLDACMNNLIDVHDMKDLLGIEGIAAKTFFSVYYKDLGWDRRSPRTKVDLINATLDFGYTILFNYIECFLRMFGFDLYIGICHREWFRRKSLVCDIMEPFRCIIDKTIRSAIGRGNIGVNDFIVSEGQFLIKNESKSKMLKIFFDALIAYKTDCFTYVQKYYRCFMSGKSPEIYPIFEI